MKAFQGTWLPFILLLMFAQLTIAAPQGPVIGTITTVVGTVTGTDQDGDGFTVAVGADLYAGYAFATGDRSVVGVRLNDGTTLLMSGNSEGSLDAFSYNPAAGTGTFDATIERGGVRYESGQLAALYPANAIHSRISTPNAVIGVRGTVIEATVSPAGRLTIRIPEGRVSVTFTRPDGTRQTVEIGVDEEINLVRETATGELETPEDMDEGLRALVDALAEYVDASRDTDATTDESYTVSNEEDADGERSNVVTRTPPTGEGPAAGGGGGDLDVVSPSGSAERN